MSEARIDDAIRNVFESVGFVSERTDKPDGKIRIKIKYMLNSTSEMKLCLHLIFDTDLSHLHIDRLNKCSPGQMQSGTTLLTLVDKLVERIPECKKITLQDISYITRCGREINLAKLKILETGQSWYNQFGYKQTSYDSDTNLNHKYISTSHESIALLLANPEIYRHFTVDHPRFSTCKQFVDKRFPTRENDTPIANISLNEYIKHLFNIIKLYPEPHELCDETQDDLTKQIIEVIIGFQYGVIYNQSFESLTKDVNVPPRGGRRSKNRRKTKRRRKAKKAIKSMTRSSLHNISKS
jgi:hypothetical protein